LKTLSIKATGIADEFPEQISHEEFAKRITFLNLCFASCELATVMSLILSFPNLEVMTIYCECLWPEEPFSSYPVTPQRTPLNSLGLRGSVGRLGEALAKSKFTSRRLYLEEDTLGVEQLIMVSSETLVELTLRDEFNGEILHPIYPLSFPVLTTMTIELCAGCPSFSLKSILYHILPTPTLTSITIIVPRRFEYSGGDWGNLDNWLARMAGYARVEGGLPVVLSGWPEGKLVWEGFLLEFRKAGGKIKTEGEVTAGCDSIWGNFLQ